MFAHGGSGHLLFCGLVSLFLSRSSYATVIASETSQASLSFPTEINTPLEALGLPSNYSLPRLDHPLVVGGRVQYSSVDNKMADARGYWLANIAHGNHPNAPTGYQWFRNVQDFGAKGDGSTDDTDAINAAASSGPRCSFDNNGCNTTSVLGAILFFPPGTYVISKPIVLDFYTQAIGDPTSLPTIKGTAHFEGIALFDSDVYIPNDNGFERYQNQNNFYRQIRNFNIDVTTMTVGSSDLGVPIGIHWQVAQATSLQNINFLMTQGGNQIGLFIENGSGGFVSDITFQFGAIGMKVGSQQFTMRNLKFVNCAGAGIQTIWNWGFTFQNIQMISIGIGIDARVSLIDSTFDSVNIVIFLGGSDPNAQLPQLLLDNIIISELPGGVTNVVETAGGQVIFSVNSAQTIQSWARGKQYLSITDDGSNSNYATSGSLSSMAPNKPSGLLDSTGKWFTRSKPQYENLGVSSFIVVIDLGAVGDGSTDDTAAINAAIQQALASGRVCYFLMGIYLVSDTIFIPSGSVIVGESWPQIMASGGIFTDLSNPGVMIRVSNEGDHGTVEIFDMLFTVRPPSARTILMEWNIKASSQGSAAMWDSHFRVRGAIGSNLQAANCPTLTGSVNSDCIAASILVYITNIWAWTADHNIDIESQTQVDVYTTRGILIESTDPTWLYGTVAEHCTLYQYQLQRVENIFLGFMQTETPYYQPSPLAPAPFTNSVAATDPVFGNCVPSSSTYAKAWALRIINSTDVFIYRMGFYSFFENYDQTCVNSGAETCQDTLVDLSFSERIFMYDLVTIGAQEVVSPEGGVIVTQEATQYFFTTVVIAYLALSVDGAEQGGSPAGSDHDTGSVTVLPRNSG
ncbi:glucan 1,3-beta-glucosidase GLUC78 precursor [Xylogone sp. PMI_703]|nr:glucan 1,3-beta-glucosidase GLUC78 precursor [Xylogone sp. PMI_703]